MATKDPRLSDLLLRWEETLELGTPLSVEELCADCPELLGEAKRRIEMLQAVDARLGVEEIDVINLKVSTKGSQNRAVSVPPSEPLKAQSEYVGLRFHAEGGLGEVFIGHDDALHRDVAVKFMHTRHQEDQEHQKRFLLEAEITGQLDHPGVVPVHGLGRTEEGRLFYVMRFIRGQTLQEAIEEYHRTAALDDESPHMRLLFRKLMQHFVSACNAIAYAHNRGIVHCDIKPENILLGKYGETLVVDWGLALPVSRDERARASGEKTLIPRSGSDAETSKRGAGTPAYMSPEQASLGQESIGPASDIYSLGATLYKLLTGRTRFSPTVAEGIWDAISRGDFPPPRLINPHVSEGLEAICLKAMALYPEHRYPTVLEFARDLERWLADEPVSAYEESRGEKIARWSRRHRSWTLSLGAAAILIVTGSIVAMSLLGQMAHREHEARIEMDKAREQRLRMAAQFAARTVANEMDLRWRILEGETSDVELLQWLQSSEEQLRLGEESQRLIQAWLDSRYLEYFETTKATSWFLTDARGNQLARSPASETIGKNYAFRDYFHGLGRDLPEGMGMAPDPIREVHLSSVFQSKATDNLMVGFSVPIFSGKANTPERKVVGVLCMTVELASFGVLRTGLGQDQVAVLADTRNDWLQDQENKGLILHHPRLVQLRYQEGKEGLDIFRLPSDLASRLEQLRSDRLRQMRQREKLRWEDQITLEDSVLPGSLTRGYTDPLDGDYAGSWLAAFEPVLIRGRSETIRDTGWVVIVQEREVLLKEDNPRVPKVKEIPN